MSQYVITDGDRFIYRNHCGKFVPAPGEMMADVFSKKQAENILRRNLPKSLRNVFYVKKYDHPPGNVKQVNKNDLICNTEKVAIAQNIQVWLDKIKNMNGIVEEATKRRKALKEQLQTLEGERLDIEHYIEFQNLNASQGYNASKELKKCRMERRTVKNEIAVLDIILDQNLNGAMVDEVCKKIMELDKRTYKPRVRTDLFDL